MVSLMCNCAEQFIYKIQHNDSMKFDQLEGYDTILGEIAKRVNQSVNDFTSQKILCS